MKRILFVDDEPAILKGLERLLRPMRDQWEMAFVESGEAAVSQLEQTPCDVIVTDMGMPGMDGAVLLQRVQERFPQVVRIVLSGRSDLEASMRAVPVAHQFLAKPCDPGNLKEVVERAANLQALLRKEMIRKIVGTLRDLPSRPAVYAALLAAIANPSSSLAGIATIMEQDQALLAKVLQLVNSAFFGLARRITSIRQAVSYLGLNTLKNLALSVEVFRAFAGERQFPGFSLEALQRHVLLTATIAKRLLTEPREAEDALVAGMLHDIGLLILAVRLPEHFTRVLERAVVEEQPLYAVEEEENGFTHAEIGAYLLGLWGLPYPVVEAVACHHVPQRVGAKRFDVLSAVYVADCLANEHAPAVEPDHACRELDLGYLDALGVSDRIAAWRELASSQAGMAVELR